MALTPGGLPYPLGTDKVVDGDDAIHALALAVDPLFVPWTNYVPALLSGGSPVNIGTGGVNQGKYRRAGKTIQDLTLWLYLGTGYVFPAGGFSWGLPVPIPAGQHYAASGFLLNPGRTPDRIPIAGHASGSGVGELTTGTGVLITSDYVFSPGAQWMLRLTYETA